MTVPSTHVVLVRGINVGGKNIVPMARLRTALEASGFTSVRTYIQCGNILLTAGGTDEAGVSDAVERVLESEFSVVTPVVTVAADTMRAAVSDAPEGFGCEPDLFHYDVAFLVPGLTSDVATTAFGIREGVDTAWGGVGVVYFRRLSAERTKSRMSSVMGSPHYKRMTIRNWRTTTALARMVDEA